MPPKKRAATKKKATEVAEDSGLESTPPPADNVKEAKKKTVKSKAKAKTEEISPIEDEKPQSPKVASPKSAAAPPAHTTHTSHTSHNATHSTTTTHAVSHAANHASHAPAAHAEKHETVAVITSGMTEEEKRAARAARFGIPLKEPAAQATTKSTQAKSAQPAKPLVVEVRLPHLCDS